MALLRDERKPQAAMLCEHDRRSIRRAAVLPTCPCHGGIMLALALPLLLGTHLILGLAAERQSTAW